MAEKQPSPLQAGFWLTNQEKNYILIICGLLLLGLMARRIYLKKENPQVYTPAGLEETEPPNE